MADRFDVARFYTGIRKDNAASQAVCSKPGICKSDYAVVALDPFVFGAQPLTK